MAYEDPTLRTFRRAVGFRQNIKKHLIPLLIYIKDDAKICDATKIIDTTIKILVNLTIPVEYLVSMDTVANTDVGRHTLYELTQLLVSSKEAFSDSRSTKAITDHIKYIMEKDVQLNNVAQCDGINNSLLLLRNILHIPEYGKQVSNCPLAHSTMQNQIIWNLFTQSIDKIIIYLLSCPQRVSNAGFSSHHFRILLYIYFGRSPFQNYLYYQITTEESRKDMTSRHCIQIALK